MCGFDESYVDNNYESYMDDYDYYRHTGELAEYFEDGYEEEYEDEYEEQVYQYQEKGYCFLYDEYRQQEINRLIGEIHEIWQTDFPLSFEIGYSNSDCSSEDEKESFMANKKLKNLNELVEIKNEATATELGLKLGNYTFRDIDDELIFFIEFSAIQGGGIEDSLEVNVVLYDEDDDILCKDDWLILSDEFNGFEVLKYTFKDIKQSEIKRLSIYYRRC